MSSFPSYERDPSSVLEWRWDWRGGPPGPWLAEGDTIIAAVVTVPEGLNKDSESFDGTTVTVWVSGGTTGGEYDVTAHITTSQGRQDQRTVKLITQER